MTKRNRRNPITLNHVLPDFSPQLGMLNVGTIQPTFELHINISRAPHSTASTICDESGPTPAVSGDAAPQTSPPPSNARRQLHGGTSSPHLEKISGNWYTIVYPSRDGAFRVTYTKTQTTFTLTPPVSSNTIVSRTDEDEILSTQEFNGYKFTFHAPRPIAHSEIDRFNMTNSLDPPMLEGRPLEIYRERFGKEHFLLTNYYFIKASSTANADDQVTTFGVQPTGAREVTSSTARTRDNLTTLPYAARSLEIKLRHDQNLVTKRTFYLDDPPVKLGDGSFGVVYQVREVPGRAADSEAYRDAHALTAIPHALGKRYAIKIFYNRQMMTRTGLVRVEPVTFNELVHNHAAPIDQVQDMSIADLFDHVFKALEVGNDMETVQARFWEILKQSERLQNVSYKRFGRERAISSNIRAIFDSEIPVNASEVPLVQTEYDTTRFRESAMFQFLRNYERNKGAVTLENLSDYAIVMEWCDATLEDVLEGHWLIWDETGSEDTETPGSEDRLPSPIAATGIRTTYRAQPVMIEGSLKTPPVGERPTHGWKSSPQVPEHAKTVSGYGMLKCLPFAERMAIIHTRLWWV